MHKSSDIVIASRGNYIVKTFLSSFVRSIVKEL